MRVTHVPIIIRTNTLLPSSRLLCGSEMQFARERLTPETSTDVAAIELCRSNLTARVERCRSSCDTCKAECTNAAARVVTSTYRCSIGLPTVGLTAAFHATDIGLDVASRYGSIRTEGRPPAPDLAWQEQFRTMVSNDISAPIAPRNSTPIPHHLVSVATPRSLYLPLLCAGVSCRKSHRESSTGGYTPPLKTNGESVERVGYIVGCNSDLDCYSRCGEQPIHGSAYVCTLNLTLYTHAGYSSDVATQLEANAARLAASGEAHQKIVRHAEDNSLYMVSEPGDDKYDVGDGSRGVCTDVQYAASSLDPPHTRFRRLSPCARVWQRGLRQHWLC